MRGRLNNVENTSDYGTMSNQVEDQLLEDLIPNLNLTRDSLGQEGEATVFNDITIEERQERVQSIINDIMSVPKLSEAGLTHRGGISQEKMRKYLSHENLSSRKGSSLSGMASKQSVMKYSNRNSGMKRTASMNKFEPNTNNFNAKKEIEIKNPIMLKSQSRMVSSLHQQNAQTRGNKLEFRRPEKKLKPGKAGSGGPGGSSKLGAGPMAATRNGQPARQGVKSGRLDTSISMDSVPLNNLGAFSNENLLLGDDTQAELRIHPPTLGDDTIQSHHTFNDNTEEDALHLDLGGGDHGHNNGSVHGHNGHQADDNRIRKSSGGTSRDEQDFLQRNIRSASSQHRKGSGRSTADPIGKEEHKHKAGSVPKYLKNRQQQWRDEAQAVLDSAPDPDCPPGHVRLPEPDRLKQLEEMETTHAALLADLYRLPVSADTRRVTEKRREIEGLLVGLDDGIRIYSRQKVFVKNTD